MILTMLAIIPSIVLLVYIYKKDRKDKEPIKLLMACFGLGVLASIPVVILESLDEFIMDIFMTPGSFLYALVEAFILAGISEELFKYLFLKGKTWKSKYFDCTFDGIVYSVFISLGFATFENVLYVFDGGLGTAITRMFTSIPGHTCFAVYMGYYYSKAKMASVRGDLKEKKSNLRKAFWIPVLLHGCYDFPLLMNEEVVGLLIFGIGFLFWIVFVIGLFIVTFIFVRKASLADEYILMIPGGQQLLTYGINVPGWTCQCGTTGRGNYCVRCGRPRPSVDEWVCPNCKSKAYWNFCARCGQRKM